jgi:hypothetical protein
LIDLHPITIEINIPIAAIKRAASQKAIDFVDELGDTKSGMPEYDMKCPRSSSATARKVQAINTTLIDLDKTKACHPTAKINADIATEIVSTVV